MKRKSRNITTYNEAIKRCVLRSVFASSVSASSSSSTSFPTSMVRLKDNFVVTHTTQIINMHIKERTETNQLWCTPHQCVENNWFFKKIITFNRMSCLPLFSHHLQPSFCYFVFFRFLSLVSSFSYSIGWTWMCWLKWKIFDRIFGFEVLFYYIYYMGVPH